MPLRISSRADDPDKHQLDVNHIIFHKGKLYSAGDDGKIKVWAPDLKFLTETQAHPCSVYSLAVCDNVLYSCSNDGTIKSWELDTLKEKGTVLKENDTEFWKISAEDGFLYAGDNQGNVHIFKQGKSYGVINVAEPVKDIAVKKNLLFTVKDNDVVITNLHLGGDKIQFNIKADLIGKSPICVIEDKLIFASRSGKDLIINQISSEGDIKEISQIKGAHDLIINAINGAVWDGKLVFFTSGWDKTVKRWYIEGNSIKQEKSSNVEIVVNTITTGEKGDIYAAGGDGHIVCLQI